MIIIHSKVIGINLPINQVNFNIYQRMWLIVRRHYQLINAPNLGLKESETKKMQHEENDLKDIFNLMGKKAN